MIYFAQAVSGGSIKIGTTENLEVRLSQLEAHYGQPLALLAAMAGGQKKEREIHDRFAGHRIGRTEQFRPAPEILEFIGRPLLVNPDPETVEAMKVVGLVVAVAIRDTAEYREWVSGISEATMIPVSAIARDALRKWASDRGLPPPPR